MRCPTRPEPFHSLLRSVTCQESWQERTGPLAEQYSNGLGITRSHREDRLLRVAFRCWRENDGHLKVTSWLQDLGPFHQSTFQTLPTAHVHLQRSQPTFQKSPWSGRWRCVSELHRTRLCAFCNVAKMNEDIFKMLIAWHPVSWY